MSRASVVRRQFRLGRPPKPGEALPLHPHVVWRRALEALQSFRVMMLIEGLEREHVTASIAFIEQAAPEQPQILPLEKKSETEEERKTAVFEQLFRPDVIAIGMIFQQYDEQEKKRITFPYQFTGLSELAIAVLRKAALLVEEKSIALAEA